MSLADGMQDVDDVFDRGVVERVDHTLGFVEVLAGVAHGRDRSFLADVGCRRGPAWEPIS